MSTNFDDIYSRLEPSGDFVQANPPIPQPQQAQPQQAPPVDPAKAARQQRMNEWQNLITNFTFSLGSGLQASAAASGGPRNRTMAGVGAALTAPQFLQDIYAKRKLQELEQQKLFQQTQQAPLIGPNGQPILGADNQPIMIPASQQGTDIIKQMGIQSAAETRAQKAEDEAAKAKAKLKASNLQLGLDENGNELPDEQKPPGLRSRLQRDKILNELDSANIAFKSSQAAYEVAKLHGTTEEQRIAREKLDADEKRYAAADANAKANLGLRAEELQIKKDNAEGPTVTTRTKADQAKVIIKEGEKLIKEIQDNPDAVGPMKGRVAQYERGIGIDDSAEATLFTHLKSFAGLQPALHGARGVQYQKEFEKAVGDQKQNKEALIASIRSLMGTAESFKEVGTKGNEKNATPKGAEHWGMVNGKWQQIKD